MNNVEPQARPLMKHQKPLFLTILALFLLTALLLAPAAEAQSKQFYWERFDVDVEVLENGDLIVTENQTLSFSGAPFTAGFRSIPVDRNGNNDGIDGVEVIEGDRIYEQNSSERPGTFTVVDRGGEVEITWFFEPALGSHRYTLRYHVRGAVRTEPSGDLGLGTQCLPGGPASRRDGSTSFCRKASAPRARRRCSAGSSRSSSPPRPAKTGGA